MTDGDGTHDERHCCRPVDTAAQASTEVVNSTAESVRRYARLATRIEVTLVAIAAIAITTIAVQNYINGERIRTLGEQNNRNIKAQLAGAQFGLDAVNCLRYLIVEHRYVNEEYHHEQAVALNLPVPQHSDLGRRPTPEEIVKACATFEMNPEPPQVNTSTTRRGKD